MQLTEQTKQILLVGGILGGALLVIVVYMGFGVVQPQVNKINGQIRTLETEVTENREKIRTYQAYLENEEERVELEEAFGRMQSKLPDVQDPIDIFELLRGYIEGTDVTFTRLEPGERVRREKYMEYPFTLTGSARYHQFGQLVNLIECNPDRLMRVAEFNLQNNDRRPSIHPMTIGITTFTFRDQN